MTLADVLQTPILSEKSTEQKDRGVYVFKVHADANKLNVKKAVEKLFSVKVGAVRVVCVKSKVKNNSLSRQKQGRIASYKKAYVQLVKGEKIKSFEA